MVKRKFAVFCKNRIYDYTINQRRNEIVWCGVLEGYDSQDILGRLNPYYHRKKDASIWAIKDGKIMNKDKLGEMLRTAQKITPEWKREKSDDRCFNNDFEKIDLKELM